MFLARRPPGGVNSRRWEFPGGKVEAHECAKTSLIREFREELGVEVEVAGVLARGEFTNRGVQYRLEAYRVVMPSDPVTLHEHEETDWFDFEEAEKLDLVPSDRDLLPQLQAALASN